MKLLLLGASGGCGRWVARLAGERGHEVTAVVRPETSFEAPASVRVLRGEILRDGVLDEAVPGHDAVLSCVGIKRSNPRNPWSSVASPTDLAVRVARLTVRSMQRSGVDRVVAISAAGVRESEQRSNPAIRFLIRKSNVGVSYRDLGDMEREYAESGLDWLAVRPVTLVDGPARGRARKVESFGLLSRVARADVALWMLDAVERPQPFTERTVMIGA